MRNHFHLVVETPEANLVAGMSWLLSAYTNRLNRRHKLTGHVFSGRYKSPLIDASGDGYFKTVCDYVHLNPVRAGLLKDEDSLSAYPWSSLAWYAAAREHRPPWIQVGRLLGEHGIPQDTPAGRAEFSAAWKSAAARRPESKPFKPCAKTGASAAKPFGKNSSSALRGNSASTMPAPCIAKPPKRARRSHPR